MSAILELLNEKIDSKHLLKHPFYQAWNDGRLSLADLQFYARQYFAHVKAFPTYLSEMHSRSENLQYRRIIASNLADEEATTPTHPELWLDFAAGIGASPESVVNAATGPRMAALISTFRSAAKTNTGLAAVALYCYEKQIPEVAAAKISGLEKHYGITEPATLQYFRVHQSADVEHAAQWATIMENQDSLPAQAEVADRALDALLAALDEINEERPSRVGTTPQVV